MSSPLILLAALPLLLLGCDGPWELGVPSQSVRNATEYPLIVSIEHFDGVFPCVEASLAAAPSAATENFGTPELHELNSGQAVSLLSDGTGPVGAPDGGLQPVDSSLCGSARVFTGSGLAFRVAWDLRELNVPLLGRKEPEPGSVYLERFGNELVATTGPGAFVFLQTEPGETP